MDLCGRFGASSRLYTTETASSQAHHYQSVLNCLTGTPWPSSSKSRHSKLETRCTPGGPSSNPMPSRIPSRTRSRSRPIPSPVPILHPSQKSKPPPVTAAASPLEGTEPTKTVIPEPRSPELRLSLIGHRIKRRHSCHHLEPRRFILSTILSASRDPVHGTLVPSSSSSRFFSPPTPSSSSPYLLLSTDLTPRPSRSLLLFVFSRPLVPACQARPDAALTGPRLAIA
ncbi:hypothetical protein QBC39DRAFT_163246 [Podospora conica]|nr:hypothetical protein QBC39DRAFT_163246 [Schizothecium conicum]